VICSVGSKRGYIINLLKRRMTLMGTNSPALTNGAYPKLPTSTELMIHGLLTEDIDLDYSDAIEIASFSLRKGLTKTSLRQMKSYLRWLLGSPVSLTLPTFEGLWIRYRDLQIISGETYRSFPIWRALMTTRILTLVEVIKELELTGNIQKTTAFC